MYFATETTWNQITIFFGSLFSGMVLGIIYAVISAEKQYIKKKVFKIVHDVIFSVIVFFVFGGTLYILNNGKIELYIVLTNIVGFALSRKLFGKTINDAIKSINRLINFVNVRLIKLKK